MYVGAEEARQVEFTLNCPNDGRVELGLEDISAVVFRGPEAVEVVFECPTCGATLRAALHVPNLMLAAMELARYAEELGEQEHPGFSRRASGPAPEEPGAADTAEERLRSERERAGEPYCEYFRRQLARVECVEDMLSEIE